MAELHNVIHDALDQRKGDVSTCLAWRRRRGEEAAEEEGRGRLRRNGGGGGKEDGRKGCGRERERDESEGRRKINRSLSKIYIGCVSSIFVVKTYLCLFCLML